MQFQQFPKLARYNREVVVTEKIDGTNAQIFISDDLSNFLTGSRNRWITPEDDNFGFSKWANSHKEELISTLGPGRHFGEWWGSGIQRGYNLKKGEKRFSLFNTIRWGNGNIPEPNDIGLFVVPVLWEGLMEDLRISIVMGELAESGSIASPGFMNPEGIVIYHTKANMSFKKTFEKDESGKWDK